MKKMTFALIFSLIILVAFSPAQAQIPKEGAGTSIAPYSLTYKAIAMGKERVQINYEVLGVIIGDIPEWLFHNSSFNCLGSSHYVNGVYDDDRGFCTVVRPDGDKAYYTYKASGSFGGAGKGTSTFVGGTGKLTGIQGGSEFTRIQVRPVAEGTSQGYSRIKGWYKLP